MKDDVQAELYRISLLAASDALTDARGIKWTQVRIAREDKNFVAVETYTHELGFLDATLALLDGLVD